MALTFIDLFAGIGGFRLGLEQAGHKCLGHCEIDKFANKSYIAMHSPGGDEWFAEDIKRTRAEEIPRADVWCFGFPCQDISVAGKQLGFKGQRSSLFFTVTRLIRDTKEEDRPKYLFIENVKNLLSVNGGTDFLKLLIELDEIGYDAEWQVLNSKNFGVPQNRERVFIIAHFRGRSGREVFPISGESSKTINQLANIVETSNYNNPQRGRIYAVDGISPTLTCSCGGGISPKILTIGNIGNGGQRGRVIDPNGIMSCICATEYKDPSKILVRENTKKGYIEAYPGDGIRLDHIGGTTGRARTQQGTSNTLTTQGLNGVIDNKFRIRKLTPKECFRLQGFPNQYFERAASVCSSSQLYKQAGNSVTVPVIKAIALRL